MWHLTACKFTVSLSFFLTGSKMKWFFIIFLKKILATLVQRYDKSHFMFDLVQELETNWNFTGCQVPHFMVVLACNEECAFFTSDVYNSHNLWSCQKVCDALVYLLDNIFIRFGTKLYRQTIGIPMGTNCAPLVADLFLFCYERDFMKSLSRENQADIIESFNSTSRYLDDLLNIDNIYFDQMVDRIYPTEIQLNRANSSDTEAPFLDLNLCISNGTFSTKFMIYGTILILI